MSWDTLAQQLLDKYCVKVDAQALRKLCSTASTADATLFSVRDAYQHVLNANLQEVVSAPGLLPRNTGSLPQATLEAAVVVQIQTSRDATQPLRPCADMDDAEALLAGAANQKQTNHRLLRLTVTDGVVEVPAIELQTLAVFRSIPMPGEKLLLKAGTEVRGGMIIMTDKDVEWLGGCEQHLKDEYLLRKQRALVGGIGSGGGGLEGAPKFAPLEAVGAVVTGSGKHQPHGAGKSSSPGQQQPHHGGGHAERSGGARPAAAHAAATHDGGDAHRRGGSSGGRGHEGSRGRGDGLRGRGHGSHGHRGGGRERGGHQHHHDPVSRDHRGGGGYRGGVGGYRGGGNTFPSGAPPPPSRPTMPQFSDADFPSLGGDW